MTRSPSAAGRALAIWAAALCLWSGAGFLYIQGSTWRGRVIGAALAAGLTVVMVLLAWRSFRRASTRSLPVRGASGWLARQPGWRAAVITGALGLVPVVGVFLIAARAWQHLPPGWFMADLLAGQVILAAGIGTFQALVLQRQRERAEAGAGRGSPGRPAPAP